MQVDPQQLLNLSKDLWATELGLSVEPPDPDGSDTDEKTWASCVKVSGDWQGAIVLECPESIVRHAAVMLFHADSECTPEGDIQDAAKELADLFGKGFRSLLPNEAKISRASLVDDPANAPFAGMNGAGKLTLCCEGRPVKIAIYEAESKLVEAG